MPCKTKLALRVSDDLLDFKGIGTSETSWDKTKYTPKIITSNQYKEIRREIKKSLEGYKKWLTTYYQTLFDILRYTGMRLGEARKLNIADLLEKEQLIVIRRQKNGRVYDLQPVPRRLWKQIRKHIKKYTNFKNQDYIKNNNGYLFFSRHSHRKYISHNGCNMFLNRLRKRSKLKILNEKYGISSNMKPLSVFSYHTLRHLYITEAVHQLGLIQGKELARHENIKSTLRYTHVNTQDKIKYINKLYN